MKRLLLLAVAAAGAVAVGRRIQVQRAEADLWAELTDEAPVTEPSASQRALGTPVSRTGHG
ncbi:DLW-39 family protein [Kineosphaera limosa]|uniref:DLW-39 family protein n=1 Tax=Kineosphaera limosa TaxID=111564 RepID=UPI00058CD655|nr:DLW-39 family protein [Kineosphaera limosa]